MVVAVTCLALIGTFVLPAQAAVAGHEQYPFADNRNHYMERRHGLARLHQVHRLAHLAITCDEFYVKFNTSSMGTSVSRWRSLGCHELGHSVHLAHRSAADDADDNSCMRQEIWPENFDTHDLDVVTRAY